MDPFEIMMKIIDFLTPEKCTHTLTQLLYFRSQHQFFAEAELTLLCKTARAGCVTMLSSCRQPLTEVFLFSFVFLLNSPSKAQVTPQSDSECLAPSTE